MSTQNGIDMIRFLCQFFVTRSIFKLITEVRQANDHITIFLILQQIRHFLCYFYRIIINHTFTFISLHQPFHLRSKTEYAYLQPIAVKGSIGFHQAFQHRTCHIIVGTYHREVCHTEQACHIFQTEIKFMITYRHGIITHKIHHLYFDFPLKQIVVRSSLRNVSAIKQ